MNTEQSIINSISKVRIKATYLPTKAKHEASINTLARIYGADPSALDAGLHFLPAKDNAIAEARNIVTAGKKALITAAHEDGKRIKSALKPMGSDNIGWYYADADDTDIIREITDDTDRKLDSCKARIDRDWDALVAEGKSLLGTAADRFVYPDKSEYIDRAKFEVKIRAGSIDFSDSAFDALGEELAASLRADQQIEREQLVESHKAGLDSFFASAAELADKIDASCVKGNRLRAEAAVTLLEEARDLQRDNWINDKTINSISALFQKLLGKVESFPALPHAERKFVAKEIREKTVDSMKAAASIGI